MASNVPVPLNKSIVQIKVGSKTFDAVYEPRCKVCNHPSRFSIEEKLLLGNSYPKIARWVSDVRNRKPDGEVIDWPELESRNIKNHFVQGHCPMDSEMMREFTERRAEELGIDLENSVTQLVDHVVVQKAVLSKGYEALVHGDILPDVKDTLAASKLLGDLEKSKEGNASIEEWQEFMAIYFAAVRNTVSVDQWQEIVRAIQHHPVMKAIDARRAIEAR